MIHFFRLPYLCIAACLMLSAASARSVAESALPDAPEPQQSTQAANNIYGSGEGSSNSSDSSAMPAQSSTNKRSPRDIANEQIRAQEKQRVLGIVPNFNTTYVSDAESLSGKQKISLAFRSAIDPFTLAAGGLVAGLHEALDDNPEFGWGPEGYFKRAGAAYLDAFNGNMIGNGILPAVFHQDPRYFRLGHGSFAHRLGYALVASYICKHDNSGRWEPNYSNVGGNIAAGAISNLYYPAADSGWGQTLANGFIVTTEGTLGGVFQEFWPDISRKFLHKDPTHGLDAEAAASDNEKKKQPLPPSPK